MAGSRVVNLRANSFNPHPKPAPRVLKQRADGVASDGKRIEGIVREDLEIVAVIAVQSVFGSNPEETVTGLQDGENHAL